MAEATEVLVDVREDIRQGKEPFQKIMQAVQSVPPGGRLVLLNIFEPVPLYGVLGGKGFTHTTERTPEGDWKITFTRPVLDLRGLEPPQPLQRALEALVQLPANGTLTIHTDRRPMLLYPKLEERGFRYESAEAPAGGFLTRIWR